mgnify:CR=1 FL=1
MSDRSTRALRLALGVTLVVLVGEAIGGWISNSLALLADAGHVLTDAAALALSLFVVWFSRQPVTPEKTFGYLRWEILGGYGPLFAAGLWGTTAGVGGLSFKFDRLQELTGKQADHRTFDQRAGLYGDTLHIHGEVQVTDRLRHQPDSPAPACPASLDRPIRY